MSVIFLHIFSSGLTTHTTHITNLSRLLRGHYNKQLGPTTTPHRHLGENKPSRWTTFSDKYSSIYLIYVWLSLSHVSPPEYWLGIIIRFVPYLCFFSLRRLESRNRNIMNDILTSCLMAWKDIKIRKIRIEQLSSFVLYPPFIKIMEV